MEKIDYSKIYEEITRHITANTEEINRNKKARKKIKAGSLYNKIFTILGLSIIPFLGLSFTSTVFSALPPLILSTGIPPVAVLIGSGLKKILDKKFDGTSQHQKMSYSEKVKKMAEYDIENEKLKKRNKVLFAVLEKLKDKEQMLDTLLSNYNLSVKETIEVEKIENTCQNLKNDIENSLSRLDIESAREVLSYIFSKYRSRKIVQDDVFCNAIFTSLITLLVFMVPAFLLDYRPPLEYMFTTLGIGCLLGYAIPFKNKKDHIRAFSSLNRTLDKDGLRHKIEDETDEIEPIRARQNDLISEIVNSIQELQTSEELLVIKNSSRDEEKTPNIEVAVSFEENLHMPAEQHPTQESKPHKMKPLGEYH